jgi:WD40 repeat protein
MLASGGGSVESRLEAWDLHAEALAKTLVSGGMSAPGRSLVASPDGAYVACVTEGKSDVSLYDTAKWKKVAHKPGKGQPTALAWRPDATLLFGVTAKGLAWAMAPDGAVRWTQTTKKVAWTACAAGGDALVLGAASGAVHVLDSATGAERAVLSFGAPITALLLTDDGRLYVATGALELSAVDLSAHVGALERPAVAPAAPALKPLPQRWHKNPLVSVALSPDRRHLATGTWLDHDGDGDDEQGELFVWDVVTGACVRRVEPVMWGVGWPDYKEMVQWSPDGQQIGAAVCTNAVAAWRLEGRAQAPLATHEITDGGSRPPSWCWRPDGQGFAIAAWTGSSVGVALVTHAQRHAATYGGATAIDAPAAPQQEIFFPDRLVWSRDGRWLCGEHGDTIEVYDMQARVLARRLVFSDAVVSWSADGALLAVREADVLRVIEAATGATRWEALAAPQGEVFLSPDGERAALLGEDEAWIVDSAGATQLADAAPASQDGYDQVADAPRWAWSPDGARGALREAAAAVVYDAQTGARGWSCEVSDEVGGVAWGAEDTLAAWTTNTLALWKIGARKPVKRYARSVE